MHLVERIPKGPSWGRCRAWRLSSANCAGGGGVEVWGGAVWTEATASCPVSCLGCGRWRRLTCPPGRFHASLEISMLGSLMCSIPTPDGCMPSLNSHFLQFQCPRHLKSSSSFLLLGSLSPSTWPQWQGPTPPPASSYMHGPSRGHNGPHTLCSDNHKECILVPFLTHEMPRSKHWHLYLQHPVDPQSKGSRWGVGHLPQSPETEGHWADSGFLTAFSKNYLHSILSPPYIWFLLYILDQLEVFKNKGNDPSSFLPNWGFWPGISFWMLHLLHFHIAVKPQYWQSAACGFIKVIFDKNDIAEYLREYLCP